MKKEKHLRIRITEDQLKKLTDVLVQKKTTKSNLIREAIHQYLLKNCRTESNK